MTFLEQADLAIEPNFLRRVQQAALKSAVDVQAELTTLVLHTERAGLAQKVLRGDPALIARLAYGVTTNVAITSGSSDSDLQFTVNSLWNTFAVGVWP